MRTVYGICAAVCFVLGGGFFGHAIGYDDGFKAAKKEDQQIYDHAQADMDKLGLCEWTRSLSRSCGVIP